MPRRRLMVDTESSGLGLDLLSVSHGTVLGP